MMEFLGMSGDEKPGNPVQAFCRSVKHLELCALDIGVQNRDSIDLLFSDKIIQADGSKTTRVRRIAPANKCSDESPGIGIESKVLPAELEILLFWFNQVNTGVTYFLAKPHRIESPVSAQFNHHAAGRNCL